MANNNKTYHRFKKSSPQTIEEKIKQFVLRNSKSGYFTRVNTIAWKFDIPHARAWEIVGTLLSEDVLEAYHDDSGEMKLCEPGKTFTILKNFKKTSKKFNKEDSRQKQ